MPTDRESLQAIPIRIERYRAVSGEIFDVTYEPHPVASYLMTVRITGDGFADEIRMQLERTRWYLIQPAISTSAPDSRNRIATAPIG